MLFLQYVVVMLLFIIIPALILCIYPYEYGKKILSKWRFTTSSDFINLVNAFQCSFKDGTNGTHDFRAVSRLYVFHKLIVLSTFIYLQSHDFITNEPVRISSNSIHQHICILLICRTIQTKNAQLRGIVLTVSAHWTVLNEL